MPVVRWMLYVWLVFAAALQVNLYPVRNSGIFSSTAALTLILVLTAVLVALRPRLVYWRSRLTVPILVLAATAVIAGVQGAVFYDEAVPGEHRYVLVEVYAVALVLLSVGTPLAVSTLVRSQREIRMLRLALVLATLVLLADVTLHLELPSLFWWPFAASQAAALVTAWLLFEKHERWIDYPAGVLLVAAVLFDVLILPFFADVPIQWLSGWIAVATPIGLLVLIRFPRESLRIGVPLAIVFAVLLSGKIERAYDMAYREGDFGRVRLWEDAIRLAARRPLLGVGPGNYLDYVMRYGELGWMLSSPHGNYQQIAAEMGLVGLGFTGWLVVRALTLGGRLYRASRDPFVRSVAAGAACGVAGQSLAAFVGDFLLPSYHNGGAYLIGATIYVWVVVGILISVERLEAEAGSAEATAQTEDRDQPDQPSGEPLQREG